MEVLITILLLLNSLIFLVIAGFHFYWAFGGAYGSKAVLPELENSDKKVFVPGKLTTFIVACLFLGIAVGYSLVCTRQGDVYPDILFYFLCIISAVTFARAIGDFRYVGFFKKKSKSRFAVNDTKFYSPLCLWIALSTLVIMLIRGF
jgi:hypothetical protein